MIEQETWLPEGEERESAGGERVRERENGRERQTAATFASGSE